MPEKKLLVGLGNPGKDYEWTRHNLGFLVLYHLIEKFSIEPKADHGLKGLIAKADLGGNKVLLLLPQTYMNLSGLSVKMAMKENNVEAQNTLVVCDDFSLDFAQLRIRPDGRDGGHNGLKSIIEQLGTDQFPRLRLGIGAPPAGEATTEYVLGKFKTQEKSQLSSFVSEAAECCLVWLNEGINKAMDQFNRRKENGKSKSS